MVKVPMSERLRANAENAAVRHAAAVARSEAEIERRTAAGNPPTDKELALNRQTLAILEAVAERDQRDWEWWQARHPEEGS